jgi:predicted phosphodiesterase
MKVEGNMNIPCLTYHFPQFLELEIYGLGDLHIGSREFNKREFIKESAKILEKENRYCVILGDIIDNGLENSKTSPYSQMMSPHEQMDEAIELLRPFKERILGWTDGNHEQRTSKAADVDLSYILADKIGVGQTYRSGICPIMAFVGERKNHHTQPPSYSIGVTHGAGGGTTLGAGLTKAERFALTNGFDALVVGHSHKPSNAPSMRFQANYHDRCMTGKQIRIMIVSGWLDYGGYPITKEYPPVAIQLSKLILSGTEYHIEVLG